MVRKSRSVKAKNGEPAAKQLAIEAAAKTSETPARAARKTSSKSPSAPPPRKAASRIEAAKSFALAKPQPELDLAPLGAANIAPVYIYDFQGGTALPLHPVEENDPLNFVYPPVFALIREVLFFYKTVFNRNSYDDAGGRVVVFMNFTENGGRHDPWLEYLSFSRSGPCTRMDGKVYMFGEFIHAPDYVAHEFAHAVTCHCSNLAYETNVESAALHESLSDVFGITFRNWRAHRGDPTAPVEWRFGAGTAMAPLSCTRNLAKPDDAAAWDQGLLFMPANPVGYSAYALSAVATLAFHRVAVVKGDLLGAAKIWYRALSDARMKNVRTFLDFAGLTVSVANGDEAVVRAAWASVGLVVPPPLVA